MKQLAVGCDRERHFRTSKPMAVTTGDIRGGSRDRTHLIGDPAGIERGRVVRVAAIAAGERAGWPVPQGLLDRIVAETSSLRQSPADLERMATAIVERAKQDSNNGTGPRAWDAANADANRYFRVVFGQVIFGQGWLSPTQATREDTGGGSSADYDVLSAASGDYSSPAGIARMRDHAHRHGVGWMANHTELLRLGPAAIELFARTNFQRETYTGLREVGMEARQIERLVRRAEESGQDANEVGRVTRDSIRAFGGGTLQGQREMARMFDDFHANPADERAWGTVHETLRHFETHGTPEQQAQSRRQREVSERFRQSSLQLNAGAGQATVVTSQAAIITAQATTAVAALSTATAAVDDIYGAAPSTGPAVVVREGANEPPAANPPPAAVPSPSPPPARLGG